MLARVHLCLTPKPRRRTLLCHNYDLVRLQLMPENDMLMCLDSIASTDESEIASSPGFTIKVQQWSSYLTNCFIV